MSDEKSRSGNAVKRFLPLTALLISLGVGLAVRAWILSQAVIPPDDPPRVPQLSAEFEPILNRMELIRPVHEVKRPNQPGDWLERFDENGQLFPFYVQYRGRMPLVEESSGIEIRPLGAFDETQRRIVAETAEFMGYFFGTPVQMLDEQPLGDIPKSARRMRDDVEQVLTTWIMDTHLRPTRRAESMATIALVTCDLWPGNLNWVFGQASIVDRVGVWSLHRNGDPHESDDAYRICLRRTLKTAVHETGHMLGIPHCIAYECCMNGSRSREENDRQPLEFCPECQAKIWWSCGADPIQRCRLLAEFCERTGLKNEAIFFRKEEQVLK